MRDYNRTFRKFYNYLGEDLPLAIFTSKHIQEFLAAQTISNKTVLNLRVGLYALWIWAVDEHLAPDNALRTVKRPFPEKRAIVPLYPRGFACHPQYRNIVEDISALGEFDKIRPAITFPVVRAQNLAPNFQYRFSHELLVSAC